MHGIICRWDVAVMSSCKRNWPSVFRNRWQIWNRLETLLIGFGLNASVKILILQLWLWRNCKGKTEFYIFYEKSKECNNLENKFYYSVLDRFKRRGSARLATYLLSSFLPSVLRLELESLCWRRSQIKPQKNAVLWIQIRSVGWIQFEIKEGK